MCCLQEKGSGTKGGWVMVFCSNHSSKAFHAFAMQHPGKLGWCFGPSSYRQPRPNLPFALDNDAFGAWSNRTEWNYPAWVAMLDKVRRSGHKPLWCAVPDVVMSREATLGAWKRYAPVARCYGWPLAFVVQDGMVPQDVPLDAAVVFVGGSKPWKWRTLPMWTEHFKRVHVGRVTTGPRLEIAERCGAESCDGTGFFRGSIHSKQAKQLFAFIEGHRNRTPFFEALTVK
jgi:hypothetical protein